MKDDELIIRIEDREELIYMLAEAAAIEHNVMCCCFYGISSLKRGVRDGPLEIDSQTNGPLPVSGNLVVCAGTGRNIDRVQTTRLCRCGGSETKPFCDNTHLKISFKST